MRTLSETLQANPTLKQTNGYHCDLTRLSLTDRRVYNLMQFLGEYEMGAL